MTIETEIAALTVATTDLITEVVDQKDTLAAQVTASAGSASAAAASASAAAVSAADAAVSASNAAAVVTGGTASLTPAAGLIPLADGTGKIANGWLPNNPAFSGEITANGGIALGDNDKATFGDGDDLQIYHDGSNSYVNDQGTGDLILRGSTGIKLQSASGALEFLSTNSGTGALTLASTTFTGEITANGGIALGDNGKATFGASDDLQIYHDGDSSYISHNTAGTDLVIEATSPGDDVIVRAADDLNFRVNGNENAIVAVGGGATTLYNSNSAKLATTSTGIDVTGTATMDGLVVDGSKDSTNVTISAPLNTVGGGSLADYSQVLFDNSLVAGSSGQAYLRHYANSHNDAESALAFGVTTTGGTTHEALRIDGSGDISFYEDTGTTPKFFWDASAESLGIGTTTPSQDLEILNGVTGAGIRLAATNTVYWDIERNSSTGNLTFTDDAAGTVLTLDQISGHVGIGVSSPNRVLHVEGTASTFGDTRSVLQLSDDTAMAAGVGGGLLFAGKSITGQVDSNTAFAGIHGQKENGTSTNTAGAMVFSTRASGFSPAERMRIDSSGNLLFSNAETVIGTNTSDSADTGAIYLCGGGNQTVGRGANIRVHGNEDTPAGDVYIYSGNVAGSDILLSAYSSTSTIQFATDNLERMRIDASGRVGIGTSAPSSYGHSLVVAKDAAGGATYATITNTNANQFLNLGINADVAEITWDNADSLAFGTTAASTDEGQTFEAMRIDSSGNLLVGKTSTDIGTVGHQFLSDGQGDYAAHTSNGTRALLLNRKTSDGEILDFRKDGTSVGSIGNNTDFFVASADGTGLRFSSTQVLPCSESGATQNGSRDLGSSAGRFKDLYLGGGVVFGTTGGSVSSKTLDDYETGTWTPTVTGSTTAGSYSNVATTGNYTKVGNLVTVNMVFYGVNGTGAGDLLIGGLPFSLLSTSNAVGVIQANNGLVYPTGTNEAIFYLLPNATYGEVRCNKADGSSYAKMQYPNQPGYIRLNITYMTS